MDNVKKYCFLMAAICALMLLSAPAFSGDFVPLRGKALQSHFNGNTVLGEYRRETPRSDGYDYTETHNFNGTVKYQEGDFKVTGIWYMRNGVEICFVYAEPSGPTSPQCGVYVEKDGCTYGYDLFDVDKNGVPHDFDDWEARHIIKGSGKSCAEGVS